MNIGRVHAGAADCVVRVLFALGLCAALSASGAASAQSWVNIPGADECRVDMDSVTYDAQADVVAFRYVCPGLEAASVAAGCTSNDWWRATGATAATPSRGNWFSELFRRTPSNAPVSGAYGDRAEIERGTPVGRGRQLVCATKDQHRAFKFLEVR
jgi:hypothetical protein